MVMQYTFFVPYTRASDNQPHADCEWTWLEYALIEKFGCFALRDHVTLAGKIERGMAKQDCAEYTVSLAWSESPWLRHILGCVADHFDRPCIWLFTPDCYTQIYRKD